LKKKEKLMNKLTVDTKGWEKRTVKINLRLIMWILVFTVVFVVADKAELYNWFAYEWMTITAIVVTVGSGIAVIVAYIRYLKEVDDLQRKIIVDASALSLGVGILGGCVYSLLVTTGYIIEEEVSDLILLMCATYVGATIFGQVRYR